MLPKLPSRMVRGTARPHIRPPPSSTPNALDLGAYVYIQRSRKLQIKQTPINKCPLIQESCAIAKMTAQCVLYMDMIWVP